MRKLYTIYCDGIEFQTCRKCGIILFKANKKNFREVFILIEYRKILETLRAYVPGKPIEDVKKEYNLEKVVKLASNENPFGCSPLVKEEIAKCLDVVHIYPDGNCTELREKLAEKLSVNPTQLIFGAGGDELISLIGKAMINPDDECISGICSFPQYNGSVISMGGKMVFSPMPNHAFDLNDILSKITDKTKLIFIANPNNPTGTVFTNAEQKEFLDKVPENILVVMDEAYGEFADIETFPNTLQDVKERENVLLLKTFSKAYGLASLRVGYGIAGEKLIDILERVRGPFNVTTIAQRAAKVALSDMEFVNKVVKNNNECAEFLYEELDKMNLGYIKTSANFIMVDIKQSSRDAFVKLMKEGYIIRPGYAFGMENYLRVTIGTHDEMDGFINALKKVL